MEAAKPQPPRREFFKKSITLIASLFFLVGWIFANETDKAKPLFIGLGAYCHTGNALKSSGLKTFTYPFDWLATPSHEHLILLLKEDFQFFTDERFFIQVYDYPLSPNTLKNTYYNILFHHDTPHPYPWDDQEGYRFHLEELKNKYTRRVHRFRQLRNYLGKVYFIRHPKWNDSIHAEQHIAYARELKEALDSYFPSLDFTLVLVNSTAINTPIIQDIEGVIDLKSDDFNNVLRYLLQIENNS